MRSFFALTAALALCAALLAGCGGKDDADTQPSASPSAAPDASMAPDSGADPDGADPGTSARPDGTGAAGDSTGYDAAGLAGVLDGVIAPTASTAGGSLQTAMAAGDLVRFAAGATGAATLGADTQAWLDGLDDAGRQALMTNWAAVRDTARSIAADYEGQKGMLESAGVQFDFSTLDMSGVEAFLNTLDSVLGVQNSGGDAAGSGNDAANGGSGANGTGTNG